MKKRKTYSPGFKTKIVLKVLQERERAERPHQSPRYKKPEQMYFLVLSKKGE
jgi:hypothetical protein